MNLVDFELAVRGLTKPQVAGLVAVLDARYSGNYDRVLELSRAMADDDLDALNVALEKLIELTAARKAKEAR